MNLSIFSGKFCLDVKKITSEDKLKLRTEFLNLMRQRFLDGLDEEFDYTKVDLSDEYDNLETLCQDEEDKYFDDEEPEILNKAINEEQMSTDSDEDYLSDKILEKCTSKTWHRMCDTFWYKTQKGSALHCLSSFFMQIESC